MTEYRYRKINSLIQNSNLNYCNSPWLSWGFSLFKTLSRYGCLNHKCPFPAVSCCSNETLLYCLAAHHGQCGLSRKSTLKHSHWRCKMGLLVYTGVAFFGVLLHLGLSNFNSEVNIVCSDFAPRFSNHTSIYWLLKEQRDQDLHWKRHPFITSNCS